MHIEKHAKYGWTVTTLAPEAWIREILGEDKINASRLPVEGTTKGGSKNPLTAASNMSALLRHHYPGNAEVNVICGDCREAFERE